MSMTSRLGIHVLELSVIVFLKTQFQIAAEYAGFFFPAAFITSQNWSIRQASKLALSWSFNSFLNFQQLHPDLLFSQDESKTLPKEFLKSFLALHELKTTEISMGSEWPVNVTTLDANGKRKLVPTRGTSREYICKGMRRAQRKEGQSCGSKKFCLSSWTNWNVKQVMSKEQAAHQL